MAIAPEAAELMEQFRWVRSENAHDPARSAEAGKIAEEVADIMAFVLSFANASDIDITSALHAKMNKNASKYPADEYKGRY